MTSSAPPRPRLPQAVTDDDDWDRAGHLVLVFAESSPELERDSEEVEIVRRDRLARRERRAPAGSRRCHARSSCP